MSSKPRVLAVIVTYHSPRSTLLRLLRTLATQVDCGIIVNNSSTLPLPELVLCQYGFEYRQMPSNVGLASALNVGFEWARERGADFVISFDQDSKPAPDMTRQLLHAYTKLSAAGERVGAVGPQQVDSRTGRLSPFIAPIFLLRQRVIPAIGECLAVDHLITSGCLVPMHIWCQSGKFLDALFIDYVDIEWSLRLRHQGWNLYGVRDAVMQHTIGSDVHRLGVRNVLSHHPHRHYYMFRNAVFLLKLPAVSLVWKFAETGVLLKRFIFYATFVLPRYEHLRWMWFGLRDGFFNRLGPLPNQD